MSSNLSPSEPTTTKNDSITCPPAPSYGHDVETTVQPHAEHRGVTDTTAPPATHREPTHKSTAHVSHSIESPTTPVKLDETSPELHEINEVHRSKPPASSKELHRSTQRRGISDAEIATHTEYVNMLLALDDIPAYWNILAAFFSWILLAGFVLFPGTFAAWGRSSSGTLEKVASYVQQVPLYIIAWVCTGIGAAGMVGLWYKWHKNYVWIVNRIFIPGLLNSLAGVLSTLANVYGTQHGTFTDTSQSTLFVTAAIALICAVLFIIYHGILLRGLKKQHDREVGQQLAGKRGEGINRRVSERVAKSKSADSNV